MTRPKILYHGGPWELEGEVLVPKQAKCFEGKPENSYNAVYATDIKELALAMAIIGCKGNGVTLSVLSLTTRKPPYGIIYEGWPKQEEIYLYTLESHRFHKAGSSGRQWISFKPVKPSKIERLAVKDHIHLIRKATYQEKEKFAKKYEEKIKSRK